MIKSRGDDADIREDEAGIDYDSFKQMQRGARYFEIIDPNSNENKNTKRKTETDMRIFTAYLVSLNEARNPESIPPVELDRHLATYFSIIKKHDGNEYEPASLRGMLCSIERYLRSKNYPVSLTRDIEFMNTRNMLKEKQKILRELAKTDKCDKQDTLASLAVQRLNQLYLAKEFGPHNATSVINALCFSFVVHLKIKKAIDHKQLLWGDIVLCKTSTDEEYLCYRPLPGYEYCRLPLKGIVGHKLGLQGQNSPLWDPVLIYKLYSSRRPTSMMSPSSPFYLGVALSPQDSVQPSWYKPIAMGVNKLNDLVRMIRDITGTMPTNPPCKIPYYSSDDNQFDETKIPQSASPQGKHGSIDDNEYLEVDTDSNQSETLTRSKDLQMQPNRSFNHSNECVGQSDEPTDPNKDRGQFISPDNEDNYAKNRVLYQEEYVSNQDSKPDRCDDEVAAAKEKISTILANLDVDSKEEVITWLNNLCVDKGSGDIKDRESHRVKIKISLEVDSDQLVSENAITSSDATVKISPKLDRNVPQIAHSARSPELIQRQSDSQLNSVVSSDNVWKSLRPLSRNAPNSGPPLKRAMSFPGHDQLSPVKNAKLDSMETEKLYGVKEHNLNEHEHVSRQNGHHELISDASARAHSPVMSTQTNIPYSSWPYDPRIALFLRNGFVQTYHNFVEMYNAGTSKINQTDS